ncbi:MAG TPA: HDIG domain-containing protein, partial [Planctomycetia bacterium]|nr:HDIG domain-containing protein [Planctomycetia bacterium]
ADRDDVLPVAVASLLWAVAFDRVYAAGLAFVLSFLVARMHPEPMYLFPILLAGTLAGALSLNAVRSRTKLMKVGAIAGLAYFIVAVAEGIIADQPIGLVLREAAWRGGGGVIAGFFLSGCLPFVEQAFGIITAISLKELADNSHPLLRELVRKAPGTFNHSWTVSILGETAAKAIGCDSELVRVGAVFHDIGKMNKAQYFIENKAPEERNRHDLLAPAMSTLVIIGHVKDGLDLGRQHHLPQPILDMIEQHHGTTRVDYFYREATRAFRENPDPDEEVEESAFRYPGPRPQSKEAAVLMLTDCVESATRALSEPTPARIEKLVHSLAMNRLLDGQFDESGLTLSELRTVEESLTKSLASVYHGRVKYTAAV